MGPLEARLKELSSWKEIAAYLGVSVRTAQMWERERGLPVRRLPGARSRVIATTADLDNWKLAAIPAHPVEQPAPAGPTRPWRRWLLAGTVAAAGLAGILAWKSPWRAVPTSARVEVDNLVVRDAEGKVLWRKPFPYEIQNPIRMGGSLTRMSWVGDLDGDGRNEVLFVPTRTDGRLPSSTPLICYSDRGVERWRYTPSRAVRTAGESFEPIYGIAAFVVAPLGPKGTNTVVITSDHYLYFPSQVAMISSSGRLLREYWHSGQLNHLEVANRGSKPLIWAAGINNAWKAATLVVLDPDDFGGTSQEPEAPDYQFVGLPPGREVQRVIFGSTLLSRVTGPYNAIFRLNIFPDQVMVETQEDFAPGASGAGVFHYLTLDRWQHRLDLSDSYKLECRKAQQTGLIKDCSGDDAASVRLLR